MFITESILNEIEKKAKCSPLLRANLCLHTSVEDKVQKMINILLPGTQIPIHRHLYTCETLVLLRGSIIITYHDSHGIETERFHLSKENSYVIDIPTGQWHNVIVEEPAALLEIKEGPYHPLSKDEML